MPLYVEWKDIALRLALTVIACGILGWERGETDRAAGMRTTMIVGLAASLSMIQTNMLLQTVGKTPDSFAIADVLRLPLGILTGVGFIGAGAILRHNERVIGLTTAATLWFVTTVGLCFGGGQLGLGLAASALAFVILHSLKALDRYRHLDRHIQMTVIWRTREISEVELRKKLSSAGLGISSWRVSYDIARQTAMLHCRLKWHAKATDFDAPPVLKEIAAQAGVSRLSWSL